MWPIRKASHRTPERRKKREALNDTLKANYVGGTRSGSYLGAFYLGLQQGDYWSILAIAKQNGDKTRCETLIFMQSIGKSQSQELSKITRLLNDTAKKGLPHNSQKFKKLKETDGIYEFKANKIRLLCFFDDTETRLIICTHGFLKSTQKTPKAHIERAEQLKREYFNEKEKGTLKHEK